MSGLQPRISGSREETKAVHHIGCDTPKHENDPSPALLPRAPSPQGRGQKSRELIPLPRGEGGPAVRDRVRGLFGADPSPATAGFGMTSSGFFRRPAQGLRQPNFSSFAARWATLLVTLLVWAPPAYAHVQKGEAIGFLSGLHHPISGLDHVLAMIAVGLWGAQLGAPAVWLLPVCFPMVMAMGGMLGLMGVHVPGIEIGIAASAILLGAAVMSEARPPLMVAAALVAFFAIFHGYAHGTELPAGESGLLYSMGFVIATGCLHGVGITIGTIHRWTWGQKLLRMAGAGDALAGVVFMWRAVA